MQLKDLGNLGKYAIPGVVAGALALTSPIDSQADVVMRTEASPYISKPGDTITIRVGLDNTNHPGEVFSAEYVLQVPSFFGNVSKGPPSTNGFFPNPKFFEVIDWPGRLSGVVDSGVGVSNTNGFIGEYTFSTIGATLGEYTLGLTHTNVYDHNVDLQPIDVQNRKFVFSNFVGDVDLDGDVDIGDVTRMALGFNQLGGYSQGDLTGDGLVSIGDLGLMADEFGKVINPIPLSGEGYSSVSSVPAHTTFALVGAVGLAGLAGRKRYPNKTLAEIARGK